MLNRLAASRKSRRSWSGSSSADSMAQPLPPFDGSKHSAHHPSRMLQLSAPLKAAFIPDVPQASCGRRGVFSQTSHPWYIVRAIEMS